MYALDAMENVLFAILKPVDTICPYIKKPSFSCPIHLLSDRTQHMMLLRKLLATREWLSL